MPHDSHICDHCGKRYGQHRSPDAKCPGETWPWAPRGDKPTAEEFAEWDRQIARYWAERETYFKGRS